MNYNIQNKGRDKQNKTTSDKNHNYTYNNKWKINREEKPRKEIGNQRENRKLEAMLLPIEANNIIVITRPLAIKRNCKTSVNMSPIKSQRMVLILILKLMEAH